LQRIVSSVALIFARLAASHLAEHHKKHFNDPAATMKRLLLALVSVLFASGVHIASFAGVIYEYREEGSPTVIGTLEIASPPASASSGWSTAAPSDLIALFLNNAVFDLGSANLLSVGGTLGPIEVLSLDGRQLDGGGFGITFPTIIPVDPTDPTIDYTLSMSFDPSSGGDFIGVAGRFTFPNGSMFISDLFMDGNWVARVPEPGTLALLGLGLAGLAFTRRRKQ
jgi:PEP-CTERM motif